MLQSGQLTSLLSNGPKVTAFEQQFSKIVKSQHAIAVSNCSCALLLALKALGIGIGDEVIVPSFTFMAPVEAIAQCEAKPIFVDINGTFTLDPEDVESKITTRTRAIIAVDLIGFPCAMHALGVLARKYDLALIEDCAQALGSTYRNRPVGYFADAACWSFNPSKQITTGEGGMVTTDNAKLAQAVAAMRVHGQEKRHRSARIGFNFKMSEISAALGLVQLQRLPKILERRNRNAQLLREKLIGLEEIELPLQPPPSISQSYFHFTVRLKERDVQRREKIVQRLNEKGVGARVYYRVPVHQLPAYMTSVELPKTEFACDTVFSLPVHPLVTPQQMRMIAKFVKEVLGE